jgi:hypothetical protein
MEGKFCQWGEHIVETTYPVYTTVGTHSIWCKKTVYWVCEECEKELGRLESYDKKMNKGRKEKREPGSQLFREKEESYYQKCIEKLKKPTISEQWDKLMKRVRP